ncbi:MAG: glycosyltransferase family 4 protein [Methyloversatilis sp.]|uniref:glycosyltransferase family 4 protein n=1 Tax=Methyloversatilis sp. TaxID=2569862 RepID=UPI0027369E65|nr:glycosyltransferase family 4 protein [Methyloversatilis sp.]MDP2867927.1 glycosyltransferase family 4 protein [Methyloversatilis sp.]
MPKLLNINSYHYRRGGSDVVYLEHASLMENLGWQNGFFSMHHPKNNPTPWSQYFVDELEFGQSYSLGQKLSMASKVVYSFEAQRKLKRLLADFSPDIAHLHCIYHHLSPSILPVLAGRGIPTVMTAHDLKIACPAYKMLNTKGICERCKDGSVLNVLKHRCIRHSVGASAIVMVESALQQTMQTYRRYLTRVIAPSRFFLDKFVEWGWPRAQFAYIPNYVDATQFSPIFGAGRYFLYFGRLAPEKGVGTLIRAAAAAGVQLKIAGTGPEQTALEVLNTQCGSPAEFLGFRSGADLHHLIQGCRAVVLPSEWYENAPMSVLESFALGKPVIGAHIGGIPEMIEEGLNGWCVPSGDTDALAERLREVSMMDTNILENMGKAAREYVEKFFNKDQYVSAIRRLYADLGVN